QRRAALTEAERRKQLMAGERWRKWRERKQALEAARNDPSLWGFVARLAACPCPSLRDLGRQVCVIKKQVERAERMEGARELRNARVRQRRRMQRHGMLTTPSRTQDRDISAGMAHNVCMTANTVTQSEPLLIARKP